VRMRAVRMPFAPDAGTLLLTSLVPRGKPVC
jgi:hypothetical protein